MSMECVMLQDITINEASYIYPVQSLNCRFYMYHKVSRSECLTLDLSQVFIHICGHNCINFRYKTPSDNKAH